MVLRNFVVLEDDTPAILHFNTVARETRTFAHPLTGQDKTITVLVLGVDELNGVKVRSELSVSSEKLAQTLEPFITSGRYRKLDFVITRSGSGFATEYQVQTRLREPSR